MGALESSLYHLCPYFYFMEYKIEIILYILYGRVKKKLYYIIFLNLFYLNSNKKIIDVI
jgi:hypothetical protein